jgi:hypothetical protein
MRRTLIAVLLTTMSLACSGCAVVNSGFADQSAHDDQAAPASAGSHEGEVLPGFGIGDLKLGMTGSEVHSLMGPAELEWSRGSLVWPSRGLGVTLTSGAIPRVACITGGDVHPTRNARNLSARTREGLGLGSTETDIISAYGQPERISDAEPGFRFLSYWTRGIEFKAREGILTHFTISPPTGKRN